MKGRLVGLAPSRRGAFSWRPRARWGLTGHPTALSPDAGPGFRGRKRVRVRIFISCGTLRCSRKYPWQIIQSNKFYMSVLLTSLKSYFQLHSVRQTGPVLQVIVASFLDNLLGSALLNPWAFSFQGPLDDEEIHIQYQMFQMTEQLCFLLELEHIIFTRFLFLITFAEDSETKQVFTQVLCSLRTGWPHVLL